MSTHVAEVAEPRKVEDGPVRVRSPWVRFALRRAVGLVLVLGVLVVATFLMVQLVPGDPARAVAGQNATPEQIATIREQLGLDQPLGEQFANYVAGLLHGDMGTSFRTGVPVRDIIATRLPFTAELALMAMVLVLLVAVPIGMTVAILCRNGRRRPLEHTFTVLTSFGGAVPEYIVGAVLVLLFAVLLPVLPAAGASSSASMILPVLAVGLAPACTMSRIVRRETVSVLEQDYMRTAAGRRISTARRYVRHALPNLLTSTLTLGGLILTYLLGGTVIVENVFAWPGLGSQVITSIAQRDYPVIQGIVLVVGIMATLLNLAIDVLLGILDPRTLTARTEA